MSRETLITDYADLGVSCGYIGNVYPGRDDRSFRVFTRLATYPGARMSDCSIHVFSVPSSHKGTWMEAVEYDTPAVRARLDTFRSRLAAGELYQIN